MWFFTLNKCGLKKLFRRGIGSVFETCMSVFETCMSICHRSLKVNLSSITKTCSITPSSPQHTVLVRTQLKYNWLRCKHVVILYPIPDKTWCILGLLSSGVFIHMFHKGHFCAGFKSRNSYLYENHHSPLNNLAVIPYADCHTQVMLTLHISSFMMKLQI